MSWISDGLVMLGFYIVFLVFRENSYTSAVIEVSNEQKVITTGPYTVVRHPMYAGPSRFHLYFKNGARDYIADGQFNMYVYASITFLVAMIVSWFFLLRVKPFLKQENSG